jgi:hypothetical protein
MFSYKFILPNIRLNCTLFVCGYYYTLSPALCTYCGKLIFMTLRIALTYFIYAFFTAMSCSDGQTASILIWQNGRQNQLATIKHYFYQNRVCRAAKTPCSRPSYIFLIFGVSLLLDSSYPA